MPAGSSYPALVEWVLEWWLGRQDPGVGFLRRQVAALAPVTRWSTAAVLALSVVGVTLVLTVRRSGADLADAVLGVGRFLLILSTSWLVLASGWAFADGLTAWIIGPGAAGAYVAGIEQALATVDPGLSAILSTAGTVAALVFISVVVVRVLVAVVLVATFPLVAAVSLRPNPGLLRGVAAWTIAVLAFRPLTAVVYRVSHELVTARGEPVLVLVVACLAFLLAAAALPAVARLATGMRA